MIRSATRERLASVVAHPNSLSVVAALAFVVSCGERGAAPRAEEPAPASARSERERPSHAGATAPAQENALAAYERARAILAADSIDGLARVARDLESSARAGGDGPNAAQLEAIAVAALALEQADDLAAARAAFGDLSRAVIALVEADPAFEGRFHVFECRMVSGYNRWVQPTQTIENPYLGAELLRCGSEVGVAPVPRKVAPQSHAGHGHEPGVVFFICPMHPHIEQDEPGVCPIGGMDLEPSLIE